MFKEGILIAQRSDTGILEEPDDPYKPYDMVPEAFLHSMGEVSPDTRGSATAQSRTIFKH